MRWGALGVEAGGVSGGGADGAPGAGAPALARAPRAPVCQVDHTNGSPSGPVQIRPSRRQVVSGQRLSMAIGATPLSPIV